MKVSLKALRVNAGLSQNDVAKEIKVTPRTIQNWENNVTFPTVTQLMKICTIYRCSINDVFLPDKLAKSE